MEKRTNNLEITIYADSRGANTYTAAYINQQLKCNTNYINNAIIVNTDSDNRTIIYLYPGDMDKNNIPNIAIDWNGIELITIADLDDATRNRIVKSIKEYYCQYPNIDNSGMVISDLRPGQLTIACDKPRIIVFNLHDWIISKNV